MSENNKSFEYLFVVPFLPKKVEYVATEALLLIAYDCIKNSGIIKAANIDEFKRKYSALQKKYQDQIENIFILDIDSQTSLFSGKDRNGEIEQVINQENIKSFLKTIGKNKEKCVWFSTFQEKNKRIQEKSKDESNWLKLLPKRTKLENAQKIINDNRSKWKMTIVDVSRNTLYDDVKRYLETLDLKHLNGKNLDGLDEWVQNAREKTEDKTENKLNKCKMLIKAAAYDHDVSGNVKKYQDYVEKLAKLHGPWESNDIENKDIEIYKQYGVKLSGTSQQTQKLMLGIRQVAPHYRRALIFGETGTGKEIVAHHLHYCSPESRREHKFLTLNCAAMTETLIESKLFGYEKGAFTGALKQTKGLFEEADGGTLFLDEIGKMSRTAQGMLLRALENGEITRMGSTEPQKVDVNVIAATNVDLLELARKGEFLFDLYFRLCEVYLQVAPLRDRKGDIADIANEIWMDKTDCRLTHEQGKTLSKYDYPGNVRELKLLLNRAYIYESSGESFSPEEVDFQPYIDAEIEQMKSYYSKKASDNAEKDAGSSKQDEKIQTPGKTFTLVISETDSLQDVKKKYIKKILDEPSTVKQKYTRLGISKDTFYTYKEEIEAEQV